MKSCGFSESGSLMAYSCKGVACSIKGKRFLMLVNGVVFIASGNMPMAFCALGKAIFCQ